MNPTPSRFTLIALLLAGCTNSGGGLKVHNNAPDAEITWPTDGEVLDAGTSITFAGRGGDLDGDDLISEWRLDGAALCEDVALESDGTTTCSAVLEEGSYTVTLLIDDGSAQTTDNVSIVVAPTNAPEVEITAPDGAGRYYQDQEITFGGVAVDAETAAPQLEIAWSSDVDGVLDIDDEADAAGNLEGVVGLTEGTHVITLQATDSDGLIGQDTLVLIVLGDNEAPDCEIVEPAEDASGDSGIEVLFEGTASDINVPSELLTAEWASDIDGPLWDEAVSSEGGTGFATSGLSVGTHRITLSVTDDRGAVCTDEVLYSVGTPPVVTIDDPASGYQDNEGGTFSFTGTASDAESLASDLTIEWYSDLDGPLSSTPLVASGASAGDPGTASFSLSSLSEGTHTITARVADSDGLYAEDSIVVIVNDLPSAPTISISPTAPVTGDGLSAVIDAHATDLEGHTMTYTYAWSLGGTAAGVTSASLPSSYTTRGDTWQVDVTPNDGYGDGAVGSATVIIGNTPPAVDVAPTLTPDPAYEADTLSCAAGATSDADGDTVTSSFTWRVNGISVSATGASLGTSYFGKGDSVVCTQVPSDGFATGSGVDSNTVTIDNTTPQVSAVAITPDPGYAASTLTCGYTFSDADGDADYSTIEWTVNGTVAGAGPTLTGGFVHGDAVVCTVTSNDGTDDGTTGSDSLTVSNTAPVLASVAVTPDPAYTVDALTCSPGTTSDDDGEAVSLSYNWTVNGSSVGATGTTLASIYTTKGDSVACLVTPTDGTTAGTTVTSNVVTIDNTAPIMGTVTLSPAAPGTEDTITATPTATDADGDTLSYSYEWYVSGTYVVTTAVGQLSGLVYFDRGDTVEVTVTPNDGTDDGAPVSSSALTVVNTVPEAPELAFDPGSPGAGVDAVYCEIDTAAYDADGDAVTYSFSWTGDGVAYPSGFSGTTGPATTVYAGDTVPAADSDLALDWVCTATPNDGYDDGASESALVTVLDVTDPDAPVLSTPERYRNTDAITVEGTCDPGDCLTVTVECVNPADGAFDDDASCGSGGTFSVDFTGLARDETTICTAFCTDAASNESGDSNTISTDVCDPEDVYEDATGYGDSSTDPVDAITAISDDGLSTEVIEGNILEGDTVDWYVIESSDDAAADAAAGIDYYSFEVELLDPATGTDSTVYTMQVYKDSDAAVDLECSTTTGGYTHYTDYVYDRVDGAHGAPIDRRACATASGTRNECEDRSTSYYVKVTRISSSVTSCAGYELNVTNGAFVCDTTTECPF